MFSAPASWSRRQICARSSGESSEPAPHLLTCQFWQKPHLRVHPLKKIVPDPPLPVIGGSSPKWRQAHAALTRALSPQYPSLPGDVLSTRHSRGQSSHEL
jgi:hypothetical protein